MSEVGLSEGDGGAVVGIGSDLRATQVGVGEVGLSEGDGSAVVAIGSDLRVAQVGVGEVDQSGGQWRAQWWARCRRSASDGGAALVGRGA